MTLIRFKTYAHRDTGERLILIGHHNDIAICELEDGKTTTGKTTRIVNPDKLVEIDKPNTLNTK